MEGGAVMRSSTLFHLHEWAMDCSGSGDVVLFSVCCHWLFTLHPL